MSNNDSILTFGKEVNLWVMEGGQNKEIGEIKSKIINTRQKRVDVELQIVAQQFFSIYSSKLTSYRSWTMQLIVFLVEHNR